MDDEVKARNRLIAATGVRLGGFAIFLMGIAVMYTNWFRPGGWPQLGAIIAIMGALDSVLAPMLLRKAWEAQDRDGR